MNEFNKAWDYIKRHSTTAIVIVVALAIAGGAWFYKSGKEKELNSAYAEMQKLEESTKAQVQKSYSGYPVELVQLAENDALNKLHGSATYKKLESDTEIAGSDTKGYSVLQWLGLFLLGPVISAVLAGIVLYIYTGINWIEIILNKNDKSYSVTERSETIRFAGKIFSVILCLYAVTMLCIALS